jgi:hypothetical protein
MIFDTTLDQGDELNLLLVASDVRADTSLLHIRYGTDGVTIRIERQDEAATGPVRIEIP